MQGRPLGARSRALLPPEEAHAADKLEMTEFSKNLLKQSIIDNLHPEANQSQSPIVQELNKE